MTVSLSSGPLMSEYLIAVMIASVCVCCERAGGGWDPSSAPRGNHWFWWDCLQAWSQAGGAAAACCGITCSSPGPVATSGTTDWHPKQCLRAAAWKTFRRGNGRAAILLEAMDQLILPLAATHNEVFWEVWFPHVGDGLLNTLEEIAYKQDWPLPG